MFTTLYSASCRALCLVIRTRWMLICVRWAKPLGRKLRSKTKHLRRLCGEFCFKELFHPPQYLRAALRLVDCLSQCGATGDAVGEPRGELFHLSFGSGHFF